MSVLTENAPVAMPQQFFRALCQNPNCHVLLGGFHIPADGGIVLYVCGKCGKVSLFRNEKFQIATRLAAGLKDGK